MRYFWDIAKPLTDWTKLLLEVREEMVLEKLKTGIEEKRILATELHSDAR